MLHKKDLGSSKTAPVTVKSLSCTIHAVDSVITDRFFWSCDIICNFS